MVTSSNLKREMQYKEKLSNTSIRGKVIVNELTALTSKETFVHLQSFDVIKIVSKNNTTTYFGT